MINNTWKSEIDRGWIMMTLLRDDLTSVFDLSSLEECLENDLRDIYGDRLSDHDVEEAFKIFHAYMRNR
jgi:hypothetical protein